MIPPPPPVPKAASKPVPKWVWFLAAASVFILIGTYVLLYFGWNWAMGRQRADFAELNPDFEFLYVTTKGKMRVKHKPSGRELLFDNVRRWEVFPISSIATQQLPQGPMPEWLRLPKAQAESDDAMLVPGAQSYDVLAELEEIGSKRGYRRENPSREAQARQIDLATCNPKTLECLNFSIRGISGGTRYQVWQSRVP